MFQARLRVAVAHPLNTDQVAIGTVIAGRSVTIMSGAGDSRPLSDVRWLVFRSRGFETEAEAWHFGENLKRIVSLSSIFCNFGVDLGTDEGGVHIDVEFARKNGLIQADESTAPNRHGLLVLEDNPKIGFPIIDIQASFRLQTDKYIEALQSIEIPTAGFSENLLKSVRLINEAMINPQALGKLVLSLSAIEFLGQNESWSDQQKSLLAKLHAEAKEDSLLPIGERAEVAEAIKNSYRLSLRQGVKRILSQLSLDDLWGQWDDIYNARSAIFHGRKSMTGPELAQLSQKSVLLCGRIVLTIARNEGMTPPTNVLANFPDL